MKLYNISLRSLLRRKAKTFFLIFSLVLAVSSITALLQVSILIDQNLENELDVFGANIIITPNTNVLSLSYGGMTVGDVSYRKSTLKLGDLRRIDSIKNRKNLATIAPKFFHVFKINDMPVMFAGVDFKSELKLKRWWELNGREPENDSSVIVGDRAASLLGLSVGDTIELQNASFFVSAVLKNTGSQDDDLIFADLKTIQRIAKKENELSLIEVSALCYDCPIEEIVRQTSEKLPNASVTSVKKTITNKQNTLGKFKNLAAGVSSLILVISILMVFSNVNASMLERIREIGVYKAIGFENSSILKIVFTEISIASIFAGLIGYVIGALLSGVIYSFLNDSRDYLFYFSPWIIIISVIISVLVGIIASIIPAVKSSRLDPTVAFRNL